MKHRLYCCNRLEVVGGKQLNESLRTRGAGMSDESPFWVDLIPVGQKNPPKPIATFRWMEDEVVFREEVFGDGSAKGPDGYKRGGSAFGMLRSGN